MKINLEMKSILDFEESIRILIIGVKSGKITGLKALKALKAAKQANMDIFFRIAQMIENAQYKVRILNHFRADVSDMQAKDDMVIN
jgi:hypothetical protein